MNLYLDDDSCAGVLVAMLRKAGHDVRIPADVGMEGRHDAEHLLYNVRDGRVVLSGNYRDFEPLHHLVIGCSGVHFGILLVRKDNDPRKDMTPQGHRHRHRQGRAGVCRPRQRTHHLKRLAIIRPFR